MVWTGVAVYMPALSVVSWINGGQLAAYAASKSAAWSLTNALRFELAAQKTQVLALHMAFVDTDLVRSLEGPKTSPEDIVERAMLRFNLADALVIHRVGPMRPQEQIVLVVTLSAHRDEAFAACEFIMDYLKSEAPFWKKEQTPEGARWVDARSSDETALKRWQQDQSE